MVDLVDGSTTCVSRGQDDGGAAAAQEEPRCM